MDVTTHPWIAPLEHLKEKHDTLEYRLGQLPEEYDEHVQRATEFVVVPTAGIVAPISSPSGLDREMLLQ